MAATTHSRAPGRRGLAALALAVVTATGTVLWAPRSAADSAPAPADLAARWLAGEVRDDTLSTGGVVDPGLAADAALALRATGRQSAAADRLTRRLLDDPDESVRPVGPGQVLAGSTAKLVLVALAAGQDPRDVDGQDLVEVLGDRAVDAPGATDDGRLRDRPPDGTPALSDRSNAFTQALGTLALARTGTAPAAVVDLLVDQQCPAGGFRLFLTGGRGCASDAAADADTTALAVLALREVEVDAPGSTTAVVDRALTWLASVQNADGSLSSSGPGAVANANSTGLASLALRVAGRSTAADRARGWIVDRQLGCPAGPADAGAVAFTAAAQSTAATGIPPVARDQFRRSTSQALLAFAGVPVGSPGPVVPDPSGVCTTTSTSTVPTSTVPSSTVPSSTLPDGTAPTSTVTSSTVPNSSVPGSTVSPGTPTGPGGPAGPAGPAATAVAVLGVSESRPATGARLAATGAGVLVPVGLGGALVLAGAVAVRTTGDRVRRRRSG